MAMELTVCEGKDGGEEIDFCVWYVLLMFLCVSVCGVSGVRSERRSKRPRRNDASFDFFSFVILEGGEGEVRIN